MKLQKGLDKCLSNGKLDLDHFELLFHLIYPTPLASAREKRWHKLPLPPHHLVRLAGDDELVEKEAATEGVTIVLEIRLRCGQREGCRI